MFWNLLLYTWSVKRALLKGASIRRVTRSGGGGGVGEFLFRAEIGSIAVGLSARRQPDLRFLRFKSERAALRKDFFNGPPLVFQLSYVDAVASHRSQSLSERDAK